MYKNSNIRENSQTFNFARMTFFHSASHVAAQLTSALQQLVCVTSLQICEWGTFVYSGGAAREESINLNMGGPWTWEAPGLQPR